MRSWAILTGVYPPQPGGVSDYARAIADRLAQSGDAVNVWAPGSRDECVTDDYGVRVHRIRGNFGPVALRRLGKELRALPGPSRVLVQYVPHAFGWRGMNVPFCVWLRWFVPADEVWTIFHEVRFPISWRQPLRHNILGVTNKVMASLVARATVRPFVTTEAWRTLLPGARRPPIFLGVPSNVPDSVPVETATRRRRDWTGDARIVVLGHFGTYDRLVSELLEAIVPRLLRNNRLFVFMGRGSAEFAARLSHRHPAVAGQIRGIGPANAADLAVSLAACDLAIQPYPDGVSGRRTTTMSSLALGVPVVTNDGPLTDDLWRKEDFVALAPSASPEAFEGLVDSLLDDSEARARLADRGRALYRSRFAVERTIEALTGE